MSDNIEVTVNVAVTMKLTGDDTRAVGAKRLLEHVREHPGDIHAAAERCIRNPQGESAGWIDDNTEVYVTDVTDVSSCAIVRVWDGTKQHEWDEQKVEAERKAAQLSPHHPASGLLTREEFEEGGYDGPMLQP